MYKHMLDKQYTVLPCTAAWLCVEIWWNNQIYGWMWCECNTDRMKYGVYKCRCRIRRDISMNTLYTDTCCKDVIYGDKGKVTNIQKDMIIERTVMVLTGWAFQWSYGQQTNLSFYLLRLPFCWNNQSEPRKFDLKINQCWTFSIEAVHHSCSDQMTTWFRQIHLRENDVHGEGRACFKKVTTTWLLVIIVQNWFTMMHIVFMLHTMYTIELRGFVY